MKKLFLALSIVAFVSAASASTLSTLSGNTIVSVIGDDKKGDDKGKKKSCSKDEKSC